MHRSLCHAHLHFTYMTQCHDKFHFNHIRNVEIAHFTNLLRYIQTNQLKAKQPIELPYTASQTSFSGNYRVNPVMSYAQTDCTWRSWCSEVLDGRAVVSPDCSPAS